MSDLDLSSLRSAVAQPEAVPEAIQRLGAPVGVTDVVVSLVDFGQVVLEPLGDLASHGELPRAEDVATTMAGRAFSTQAPVMAERAEGVRLWVPIHQGSDRTGVLAVTVPEAGPAQIEACQELAVLAGCLVAVHDRASDVYNLHRRRRAMTLAASMQWDLLPPLVLRSSPVTVAGMLEPAYEVAGDCFDYAINWPVLDMAIFDSMGHGLNSAVLAGLAVGCYRHGRRHGRALRAMHRELDDVVSGYYHGQAAPAFVTGQLAQLNLADGHLRLTNAGHPLPLLLRHGRVVGEVPCRPTPPWGVGLGADQVARADVSLEPGDAVLFYTDGVTEGRPGGRGGLGLESLVDLLGQTASDQLPTEEVVRRVGRAVLEHHGARLDDDATLCLVHWDGPT